MNYSRREFFKTSGLATLGLAGLSAFGNNAENIRSEYSLKGATTLQETTHTFI